MKKQRTSIFKREEMFSNGKTPSVAIREYYAMFENSGADPRKLLLDKVLVNGLKMEMFLDVLEPTLAEKYKDNFWVNTSSSAFTYRYIPDESSVPVEIDFYPKLDRVYHRGEKRWYEGGFRWVERHLLGLKKGEFYIPADQYKPPHSFNDMMRAQGTMTEGEVHKELKNVRENSKLGGKASP